MIGQRLVGTLASVHTDADRTFGPDDLRLLNLFAPQAAVAIENARLYTEAFRQHQFFQTVVDESPVAIVTLDLEGRITSLNPAFERLFGYSPFEAVGKELDSLLNTPETLAEAKEYTAEAAGGSVTRGIGRRRRKDGTFVNVEFTADAVQVTGEAVAVLALYHDVTELLEARHAAEEANQAKSMFLANMSHELRTPLNAIIGYSEMLQEEAEEGGHEEFVPDLGKVHSAGRHLLALINDILDLSKIEAGKMDLFLESVDIQELVRGVESTVAPLVQANENTLDVVVEGDPGSMVADVTKVRQVLLNLLSNAAKFTEKGQIELRVSVEGDDVVMDVADQGIGMSPDQLKRIFDAFGQADASTQKRYGGTGLGLVISREFCRIMGGDITVLSAPGHGTTFTVRIPREVRAEG
jgi:PAS domain S-box-containing protein